MPPKPAAAGLTREQAMEMQGLLIAGYSDERFQKRLHSMWYGTTDPVQRMMKRQELCLEVQGPIIARYGYEPNRKGVALSVRAFSLPHLRDDPDIAAGNQRLGELVNPDAQLGTSVQQKLIVPEAKEPVSKQDAPPVHVPGNPRAYKASEDLFLLHFRLAPPEGLNQKDPILTRASALAMLDELLAGFSKGEFQRKLRDHLQKADNPTAAVRLRHQVCMEVQIPIISKYGFEGSFTGVVQSAHAFTPELMADAEIAHKNKVVFWLIDLAAQAATPVPSGPAKIVLFTTVRACNRGGFVCEFSASLSDTIKNVKENIQLTGGIMRQAQRILVGPPGNRTEVDDWVTLNAVTHAGNTLDVWVEQRRPEIVEWLLKLKNGVDALNDAPPDMLADTEFLVPAIGQHLRVLQFAAPDIRADRDFMLRVVRHHGQALQYAPPALRADSELVLAAVARDGWALQHAAAELQADRGIVMAAVNQDGWSLQFAAPALRADREVVLTAASKDAWIIANASPELQADREVVITALRQDWRVIESVVPALRADREVILAAIMQDGMALEHASPELKADREVVLAAVRKAGDALRCAHEKFAADRTVVLAAVKTSGVILGLVAPDTQDLEIALAAISQDARAMQYVVPRLREAVREKLGMPSWPTHEHERDHSQAGSGAHANLLGVEILSVKKHFEILGLPVTASHDDIRRKYKVLALRHHPDKHLDNPEKAKEVFQAINSAFQALKDAYSL